MRRISLISVLVAGALMAPPLLAQSNTPRTFQPTSQWVLDYGNTRCQLAREFTDGEDTMALQLLRYSPSDDPEFRVIGKAFDWRDDSEDGWIQLGTGTTPKKITVRYGQIGDRKTDMLFLGTLAFAPRAPDVPTNSVRTPESELSFAKAVDALTFEVDEEKAFRLELGDMEAAWRGMQHCMDDLLVSWGLDPEAVKTQEHGPKLLSRADFAREVQQTYPARAISRSAQGPIRVAIIVGPGGEVERCLVQSGVKEQSLQETVCRAYERFARYEPARSSRGVPIRSYSQQTVRYVMP